MAASSCSACSEASTSCPVRPDPDPQREEPPVPGDRRQQYPERPVHGGLGGGHPAPVQSRAAVPQLFLATALFNLVVAVYLDRPGAGIPGPLPVLAAGPRPLPPAPGDTDRIPTRARPCWWSNFLSHMDVLVSWRPTPAPSASSSTRPSSASPSWAASCASSRPSRPGTATGPWAAVERPLDAGDLVAVFPEGRPGAEVPGRLRGPLPARRGPGAGPAGGAGQKWLQSSLFSRVPRPPAAPAALLAHVSLRVGDPAGAQAAP